MLEARVKDLNISEQLLQTIRAEVDLIIQDDEKYPKKIRTKNFYKKLSPKLKTLIEEIMTQHPESHGFTWHYEVFYSQEAVAPHNDRNLFLDRNERCERGMIIPLKWSSITPKTRFFDLSFEDKVNWDGTGFSTLAKEKREFDKSSMERFLDLEWKEKTILFFDSRQIHEATSFGVTGEDYKLSLNGLGYSSVN